jgi:hypothetical protein
MIVPEAEFARGRLRVLWTMGLPQVHTCYLEMLLVYSNMKFCPNPPAFLIIKCGVLKKPNLL